ncbi:MAG: glycosyltransferase N-terminal domain-containing protein [bacterium]
MALVLFSPLLAFKFLFDRQFRKNFSGRLGPFVPEPVTTSDTQSPTIWVHAASIGEIRLAIKLIHTWLQTDKEKRFFITTNTIQSKILGERETGIPVLLAPFDFSFSLKKFIRLAKPQHLILIETEIWPNMVRLMAETGQVTIVNARLSDRYFNRYLRAKFLFKKTIAHIDWILARDQISTERFLSLGVPSHRVFNVGNLKYEVPQPPAENVLASIRAACLSSGTRFLFVVGSLQPEELTIILPGWKILQQEVSGFQMVLIPRHPDKRDEFARILTQNRVPHAFSSTKSKPENGDEPHVCVIDQMGILKSWYFLADAVFVGGSLCDRGGQNMVEAVGFKKPVCIGPYATNFKDEVDLLLSVDGLQIVHNTEELVTFIRSCHQNQAAAVAMGERGYQKIAEQAHALDANVRKLSEIYSQSTIRSCQF